MSMKPHRADSRMRPTGAGTTSSPSISVLPAKRWGRAVPTPILDRPWKLPQAGFSLVEVMCAIVILGIALVGLTQAITTALSSSKESELQTAAVLLAAGQIETLRAEGFLTERTTEGEGGEGLGLYRWKQSIRSAGIEGLFDVSVSVENAKTGTLIYELRTLLFEPPAYSASSRSSERKDSLKARKKERRM